DLLGLTPIYRYMYEQVSPMPKHHVLIGAFTGQRWSTVSHMQPLTVQADSKSGSVAINAHLATIAVGHFVGQAWFIDLQGLNLEIEGRPKPSMRVIWPYKGNFIWPPGPFLSAETLEKSARTNFPVHPSETLPDSNEPWK